MQFTKSNKKKQRTKTIIVHRMEKQNKNNGNYAFAQTKIKFHFNFNMKSRKIIWWNLNICGKSRKKWVRPDCVVRRFYDVDAKWTKKLATKTLWNEKKFVVCTTASFVGLLTRKIAKNTNVHVIRSTSSFTFSSIFFYSFLVALRNFKKRNGLL